MRIDCDVLIIGGGPAGLCAAKTLCNTGLKVLMLERDPFLGGQLVKQTHLFFGSKEQYAGTRGFEIGKLLTEEVTSASNVTVMLETTASGFYLEENFILALEKEKILHQVHFKKVIVATGASEKSLLFEGNDLPGIYGAGAVQTLMNLYGVLPGQDIVMVGSGNIGLIVSYQLLQAGVKVKAIIEAAPVVGGYFVHAAKVRRMGIPIYTQTTIKRAIGQSKLEKIETICLDANWQMVPGTKKTMTCDTLCLAVGLAPMSELLWQFQCDMQYVSELGGYVAKRDSHMQTTHPGVFIAGDVSGVEEASSAMLEGTIAGLSAAASLHQSPESADQLMKASLDFLEGMHLGPIGEKIRSGLSKVEVKSCM